MSEATGELDESALKPAPATLAVLATGGQIACFWFGFELATGRPPQAGSARLLALLGLAAVAIVSTIALRHIRRSWIRPGPVLIIAGVGLLLGAAEALYLPEEIANPNILDFGDLWVYRGFLLYPGAGASLLAALVAFLLKAEGKPAWRYVAASPVLLGTGLHLSLLVGLIVQAEALGEVATQVRSAAMFPAVAFLAVTVVGRFTGDRAGSAWDRE